MRSRANRATLLWLLTLAVFGFVALPSAQPPASLFILDGMRVATDDKSAAYTLTATDVNITADAAGGAFSLDLVASPSDGQTYFIRRVNGGANVVTIDGNGDNINGAATLALNAQYESVILVYNSTDGEWGIY